MESVLLVEDEKMVADVVARFFRKIGFSRIDIAYNLAQGIEKSNGKYDIVILDINLGEEMSFPVLEKIKKEKPETPVLMFSGYDSDDNIKYARSLGADGFIPKPFRLDFLQDFLLPKIEHMRQEKGKGQP